jgi:hypothetical protein
MRKNQNCFTIMIKESSIESSSTRNSSTGKENCNLKATNTRQDKK